jgi:hypothetical protein
MFYNIYFSIRYPFRGIRDNSVCPFYCSPHCHIFCPHTESTRNETHLNGLKVELDSRSTESARGETTVHVN